MNRRGRLRPSAGRTDGPPLARRLTFAAMAALLVVPALEVVASVDAAAAGPPAGLLAPGTMVFSLPPAQGQVDGTIETLAPGSSTPTALLAGDQPLLSPDGEELAYEQGAGSAGSAPDQRNLWVLDLATAAETEVVANTGTIDDYSFDPTGQFLYYATGCSWWEVPITGGQPTQLASPTNACTEDGPVPVPGTTGQLWGHDLTAGLFTVNEDGATPADQAAKPVTGTAAGASFLSFSPDGAQVAYLQGHAEGGGAYDADHGNLELVPTNQGSPPTALSNLTGNDQVDGWPLWSPDGKEVLAAATVGGQGGIWAFRSGSSPVLLSAAAAGADFFGGVVADTVEVSEPFDTSSVTASSWVAGGSGFAPCLTASSTTTQTPVPGCDFANPPTTSSTYPQNPVPGYTQDASGSGVLRLTDSGLGEVGDVYDNAPVPLTGGLIATFNTAMWGNGQYGADGLSFYLLNGSTSVSQLGTAGGGLGYADSPSTSPPEPGIDGGYLAVGLDEFGNFTSDDGGKDPPSQCPGTTPYASRQYNSIAIRGPGQGESGYCLLAANTEMDPTQHDLRGTGASRTASTRTVTVYVPPAGSADQDVTVVVDFGPGVAPETLTAPLPEPRPASVKIGFGASNGGVSDIHEVSNLVVGSVLPTQSAQPRLDLSVGSATVTAGTSTTVDLQAGVDASGSQETEPVQLDATLPAGLSVNGTVGGGGWSCPAAEQTTTSVSCTSVVGTVLPGGSYPALSVPVAVGSALTGDQVVEATVVSGDAPSASASGTLDVQAPGTGTSSTTTSSSSTTSTTTPGSGGPQLAFNGTPNLTIGGSTTVSAVVTAGSSPWGATSGSNLAEFFVPLGATSGEVLDTTGTGTGWSCITISTTLLQCRYAKTVAAGASSNPLTLTIRAPVSFSLPVGSTQAFVALHLAGMVFAAGQAKPEVPYGLVVQKVGSASLSSGLNGPTEIVPGTPAQIQLDLTNTGKGATAGALTVQTTVRASDAGGTVAGAGISATGGSGWTCSPDTGSCSYAQSLAPGAPAPPLTLAVTMAGNVHDLTLGGTNVALTVASSVATGTGTATASSTANLAVQPFGRSDVVVERSNLTTASDGTTAFDLGLANQGDAGTGGPVSVTESIPADVTASWTAPAGESCSNGPGVDQVTCSSDGTALAAGHSLAPIAFTLTPTQPMDDIAKTGFPISEVITAGSGISQTFHQSAFVVPPITTTATTPVAQLEIGPDSSTPEPFDRGATDEIDLTLGNGNPTDPVATPVAFAAILPSGTTLGTASATDGGFQCTATTVSTAVGAFAPAMVCAHQATTPSDDATGTVTEPVTVSDNADPNFDIYSGLVRASPISGQTLLQAAVSAVHQLGSDALTGSGPSFYDPTGPELTQIPVSGFVPNAGPAQTVYAQSESAGAAGTGSAGQPAPVGGMVPTEVTLDASGTTVTPSPLTYEWCQVSGPAVTWLAPNDDATDEANNPDNPASAAGAGLPALPTGGDFPNPCTQVVTNDPQYAEVFGVHPRFDAPVIAANPSDPTASVPIAFMLVVTDGHLYKEAYTQVNLLPPNNAKPPVIGGSSFAWADCTGSGSQQVCGSWTRFGQGQSPPAGSTVEISESSTDLNGRVPTWNWTVDHPATQPPALTQTVPAPGETDVEFLWPGSGYVQLTGTTTDGLAGANGLTLVSTTQVVVGAPPPTLTVAVTGPTTPQQPGATVHLSATSTGGQGTVTYQWEQRTCTTGAVFFCGWHALAGQTSATLTYTVPASAAPGSTVTLQVEAMSGSAPDAQLATQGFEVDVGTAPPLTVTLAKPAPAVGGTAYAVAAPTVSGGAGSDTYAWSVTSSNVLQGTTPVTVTLTNPTSATPSFTAPSGSAGTVALVLTVKDGAGAQATASETITVGTIPTTSTGSGGSTSTCAALIKLPQISFPGITLSIPAGAIASAACSALSSGGLTPPTFTGVSLSLLNGTITGTGIGGTITLDANGVPSGIDLTAGTLSLPSSWKLPPITLATSGNSLDIDLDSLTGGIPALTGDLSPPAGVLPFLHTPKFLVPTPADVSASVAFTSPGGVNQVTVSGTYCSTGPCSSPASATVSVTATVVLDASGTPQCPGTDGPPVCGTVTVNNLGLDGATFQGSGTFQLGSDPLSYSVKASMTPTSAPLVLSSSPSLAITAASLSWDNDGLNVAGEGTFDGNSTSNEYAGRLGFAVAGSYEDTSDFSLQAVVAPNGSWKAFPGLTLTGPTASQGTPMPLLTAVDPTSGWACPGTLNADTLCGSLDDAAGTLTFTVAATQAASAPWYPLASGSGNGPLSITGLKLAISNVDPSPDACQNVVSSGDVYITAAGAANLSMPGSGSPITLTTQACLDVTSTLNGTPTWALQSSAPLSTWAPFGSTFQMDSVSLTASDDGTETDFTVDGSATVLGTPCNGLASLEDQDGSGDEPAVVLDASCSGIPGLPLPGLGAGHIIYGMNLPSADTGWYVGDLGASSSQSSTTTGPLSSQYGFGSANETACLANADQPGCVTVEDSTLTAVAGTTVPASLSSFVQKSLGAALGPDIVFQADLGGGDISLSGTLSFSGSNFAGTGPMGCGAGGIKVFETGSGTSLAINTLSLDIDESGTISIGAGAFLNLPGGGGSGSNAQSDQCLLLNAALTLDVAGPSLTASFSVQGTAQQCQNSDDGTTTTVPSGQPGGIWCNAVGINGLDMGAVAIQGGIDFSTVPPTPSIGFGATIDHLPAKVANLIGFDQSASEIPILFLLNISVDNPIFELSVGSQSCTAENQSSCVYAMHPLKSIDPSLANDFNVAQATILIAPAGGSIGPYTVQPGFSFRFVGQIMGTTVAVDATLDLDTLSLTADVDIGTVNIGVGTLDATTLTLDISPTTGFDADFHGGFQLAGTSGGSSLACDLAVTTTFSPPAFSVTLNATESNITLVTGLTANTLDLQFQATVDSLDSFPSGQFTATANLTVLGTPVLLQGAIQVNALGIITGGSMAVGMGDVTIAPGVSLSGPGCQGIDGTATSSSGPCLELTFDALAIPPTFGFQLAGDLSVLGGFDASFNGTLDDAGIHLTAGLALPGLGTVNVAGSVYFGSGVSSAPEVPDLTGDMCQPQAGDFYLSTNGSVSGLSFGGIAVDAAVSAGSLAGCDEQWVKGDAALDVLGSGVSAQGQFSMQDGNLDYDLTANGTLTIGGVNLANATVTLSNQNGITVSAGLNAGIVTASLSGGVWEDGAGLHYDLTGALGLNGLNVGGTSLTASGSASLSDSNGLGGSVQVAAGPMTVQGSFSLDPDGSFSVTGSGTFVILSKTFTYQASFCEGDPGGTSCANSGFYATLSAFGYSFSATVTSSNIDVTASTGQQTLSPVCAGPLCAQFSFNVTISVGTDIGANFNGSATLTSWCNCPWPVGYQTGPSFGFTFDGSTRTISTQLDIFGFSKTLSTTY